MKINTQSLKTVAKTSEAILTPAQCLQELITAYTEYQKIKEEETNKRSSLKTWETTEIARINALRKIAIEYLENSFDERKENFQKMFDLLDVAISQNDNKQLALTLNSITDLATSNPLEKLSDLDYVSQALKDPNYVWEF